MATHGAGAPTGARAHVAGRAVVTGASSGIGAAITMRLLDAGWRVTGVDRGAASIRADRYDHIVVDLADAEAIRRVARGFDGVNAVVHAAGHMRAAPLGELDPDDGEAMWRIHVRAPEILLNEIAGRLPAGARVVLIGSRVAMGAAGRSQYAAVKSALVGMARSWAAELVSRGVTVNVVAPAATDTPMLRESGRASSAPKLPPIGRYVSPDEVAGLAAFLLGPDGGAITGQQLVICGGASL